MNNCLRLLICLSKYFNLKSLVQLRVYVRTHYIRQINNVDLKRRKNSILMVFLVRLFSTIQFIYNCFCFAQVTSRLTAEAIRVRQTHNGAIMHTYHEPGIRTQDLTVRSLRLLWLLPTEPRRLQFIINSYNVYLN